MATTCDEITANAGELIAERWHGTQAQLADHMQLGQVALSDRLRGRTRWTACDLSLLADLLRVEVGDLYAARRDPLVVFAGNGHDAGTDEDHAGPNQRPDRGVSDAQGDAGDEESNTPGRDNGSRIHAGQCDMR